MSCLIGGRLSGPPHPRSHDTNADGNYLSRGLLAPLSVETDAAGRLCISGRGTGQNDGRVSKVRPDGKVYPVITNLYSFRRPGNELDATDHLSTANGVLCILTAKGLYYRNPNAFKTGDAPVSAATLTPGNSDRLNMPTNLKVSDSHIAYVISMGDVTLANSTF